MFLLTTIRDSVRIAPAKLAADFEDTITDELNAKFSNKVVPYVGLAISVLDICSIGDPLVHQGDGFVTVKVEFRLITFRPFSGQVVLGKVRSCDEQSGIRISLGFFDDIIVPSGLMPEGTRWDAQERVWVWQFDGNDMFIDPEEPIRFRVVSDIFMETAPSPKELAKAAVAGNDANAVPPTPPPAAHQMNPPYRIIASIADDGLGLISWWS